MKRNNREFYSCVAVLLLAAFAALIGVGCDGAIINGVTPESGWMPGDDVSERGRTGASVSVSLNELIPGASGKLYEGEFAFFSYTGIRAQEASEILAAHELSKYETPYGDAKCDIFYSKADAESRLVYDMLIYAFDNGYERACFSTRALNSDDVTNCMKLLAADHPFFEASMNIALSSVTAGSANGSVTFYSFSLSSLDSKSRQQKMDAYVEAQRIIADVSADADTQSELAEALYSYVTHNVKYDEHEAPSYLYDALIDGKSVCDGFAESICLLFNLAGIRCACVPGDVVSGTGGHVWNIAEIDGEFTQLDATFDAGAGICLYPGCTGIFYRLSDEQMLLDRTYDRFIAQHAPICANGSYFDSLTGYTASDFSAEDGAAIADAFIPAYNDGARAFIIKCDTDATLTNELILDMAQGINDGLAGRIDAQRLGYQLIDERKLMILLAE